MSPIQVRWHDVVGSTQDAAHDLAATGAPHGAAVAARTQTVGRGSRGRPWDSAPGGLWLSVVCRPASVEAIEVVGLRVGLVLAGYLQELAGAAARVTIKWPNDLLLQGKKVAGILAEARWQGSALGWVVVGVGINVANTLPVSVADTATRLRDHGIGLSAEQLAPQVAARVAAAGSNGSALSEPERRGFAEVDWLHGRRLLQPEAGVSEGISASGRLRVRRPTGELAEALGTVQLDGAAR